MNVDRYITDEAVQAAYSQLPYEVEADRDDITRMFAAALPHVVPLIRADVLRETADRLDEPRLSPSWDTEAMRRMADEAAAE